MSNEAAGPWPTWDELFPPTPDPGTEPVPNRGDPGSMMGRLLRGDPNNWDNKNQRYPAPDYGPAPDPNMAPEGMVANPYYNLPGNAQYISADQAAQLADLNSFYTRDGGYRYDAYDATLQTPGNDLYQSPAQLGYDPGAPWQRQEDYYAALKAKNDLGQETIGNYVNPKVARVGTTDVFGVKAIPQGYDMRQGDYYQPDGTVGAQNNLYVPGDPLFFGISDKEKKFVPADMSYLDYVMSQDVNPNQPRANSLGQQGFGLGGVVTPDTATNISNSPAYDYLRGMTPASFTGSDGIQRVDPNPFRGNVGTSTAFTAEAGDTPNLYPGVSFYEAAPDGSFKKVTSLTPGKAYYGIRESYDFSGLIENPTMTGAPAGTVFQTRTGDGGDSTLDDIPKGYSVGGVRIGSKTYTAQEIADNAHGYGAGVIPAGSGITVTKKPSDTGASAVAHAGGSQVDALVAQYNMSGPDMVDQLMNTNLGAGVRDKLLAAGYAVGEDGLLVKSSPVNPGTGLTQNGAGDWVDPSGYVWYNDGTDGGIWLTPDQHAKAKSGEIYWDPRRETYVDPNNGYVYDAAVNSWVPPSPVVPEKTNTVPTTSADGGSSAETPSPAKPIGTSVSEWLYSINSMRDNPYDRGESAYEIPIPANLLPSNSDDWPIWVDIYVYGVTADGKETRSVVKKNTKLEPGKKYTIEVNKSDLAEAAKYTPEKP